MNFDKIINRRGTFCTQWDYIEDRFGKGTKDLTPFSISDMDFESPKEIIDKIIERTQHKIFGYTRWNHFEYKDSIKNWYINRYNTNINNDWIVYSPSVIYSISLSLELIAGKNGKVMTHTPRYDGFSKILKPYHLFEIELTEKETGIFETNFDEIENGFKQGVKVFLLCNPENPTGKIWKKNELEQLINLCKKYNVILVSDDIHMDIARKNVTPVLKLDIKNCIIFSSPSKTFNTPALGGSYGIIPDNNLREKFLKHTREVDSVSSPTIFGVISTITAYNECAYWVDELNEYLTNNCKFVVNELNGYKGIKAYIPEATYLIWIDFKNSNISPKDFQTALLDIGKVAIMSGEAYGDEYKIRLNVAAPIDKVKIGVNGIKRALDYLVP